MMKELNSKKVFACIGEGVIITDLDGVITYINPAAEEVTEQSSQTAIGMAFDKVFSVVNATTGEAMESPITMALDTGEAVELRNNIFLISRSGIKKLISATCSPIRNSEQNITGIIIIFRDITRIKTIEEELHREWRSLEIQLESNPLGMAMVDENIVIRKVNPAFVKMLGYSQGVTPKPLSKLVRLVLQSGKPLNDKIIHKTLIINGENKKLWYKANFVPVTVYGEKQVMVVIDDITDLKATEKQLEGAREAAVNANKAKSEFLANMSHEIRTPLNGIVGMLNLTLISDINEKLRDNLNVAKSCADSLLKVINDILDFSKMEAGKLTIDNTNFNIYKLIEDVIKAHSVQANHRHLSLRYQFSSGIPTYLIGDSMRIKQILDNLIGNALKFTENGSILLSIERHSQKMDSFELLFSVSDTGIGIAESEMDRLFQCFSQINGSTTRKFGGTGLGLAISKQLVERMGGTIRVESKKGEGSTFFFTLPLMVGQVPVKKEADKDLVKNLNISLKVLLVEDDEVHQNVFKQMLSNKGHTMQIAPNGKEALDIIKKENFDIIFMDIKMPEIDGIDTTHRIRQMEGGTKHIPIVAVTAYALKGDRERFLALGMDEYLAKPVQIEELYAILDRYAKKIKEREILDSLQADEKIMNPTVTVELHDRIGKHIQSMKEALDNNEITTIEKEANIIKKLADSTHADDLKRIAFTIELAARREDLKAIINEIPKISDAFKNILQTRGIVE